MQIPLTVEERALVIHILEEHARRAKKKGLDAEQRWGSELLDKVAHNEMQFSVNETEFLKNVLETFAPDDLRRIEGAHEVGRERQLLTRIIGKLTESNVVSLSK